MFLFLWAPKEKRGSVDRDVCGWLTAAGNARVHEIPLLPQGGCGSRCFPGQSQFFVDQRADHKTSNSFIVSLDLLFCPFPCWEVSVLGGSHDFGRNPSVCHEQHFLALIPFLGGQAGAPSLGMP